MSMMSWTEIGYGYPLFIDNFDNIKEFLANHTDILGLENDVKEKIMQCDDDEGSLENAVQEPVPWAVARVMNALENTDIFKGYQSCGNTDQDAMIGVEPLFPWDVKHIMTQDEVNEIMEKYSELLGIYTDPDFFQAHYYG